MLEPEYAALERIHVIELDRGRKVDEPFDEASTVTPVAIARRRSVCTGCGVQYGDEACDRSLPTARYSLLPVPCSCADAQRTHARRRYSSRSFA
jgi:hypothetical protein